MADNTGRKEAEEQQQTEDPEEVASREAGEQSPAPAEMQSDAGQEVDPAVHVPHTVARKR